GQALGANHADFAAAIHELGRLNHRHVVEHTPEIQLIYNTVGRSNQIFMFYDTAKQVRKAALGSAHPAYAQSLYALAMCHKDQQDQQQSAVSLLDQALVVQRTRSDPLPTALSLTCRGDLAHSAGDAATATTYYREALQLLPLDSLALQSLDSAEQHARDAGP